MKVNEPTCTGDPEMTPVELSVIPLGTEPERRLHVYGAFPPLTLRLCAYCEDCDASGNDAVSIARLAEIVSEHCCDVEALFLSITISVYKKVPTSEGTPLS